jgi:hypothetical protein
MGSNILAYKRNGTKFYTEFLDLTSWWHNVCNGNLTLDLILRTHANAPWYVSNLQLHTDLGIPIVAAEIYRSSLLYHRRLTGHYNALVAALSTPPNVARRLKLRWPSDLHSVTGD